ncbi:hypothetical protein L2E82_22066 [Cichorium intybus]|uniref:Uncharacterized protein n=1 Tax=Cichorium intybus TaxID=13427 RepID=A0ACB9DWW5_CICIN|nr:hypothetical protein L2E82_22066 [Cichorium intybus]
MELRRNRCNLHHEDAQNSISGSIFIHQYMVSTHEAQKRSKVKKAIMEDLKKAAMEAGAYGCTIISHNQSSIFSSLTRTSALAFVLLAVLKPANSPSSVNTSSSFLFLTLISEVYPQIFPSFYQGKKCCSVVFM